MGTEIQRYEPAPGGLAVRSMDDLARMAKMIADSGMYKGLTAHAAGVKMLHALAMGFDPIAGLTGVDLIDGNPTPNGHFWAAALESHPRYDYEIVESTAEKCTIRFMRDGRARGEVTWTMDDARRAKLAGKDNWAKFPRAMLYNRAMTEGGRMYCPQLFGGVRAYLHEELEPDDQIGSEDIVVEEAPIDPFAGATAEQAEAALPVPPEGEQMDIEDDRPRRRRDPDEG